MKLLIAGGGIAGLSAALCLQKAGYDVQVFEQAASFADIGAGVQCGANAVKVLDYLGLLAALEAVSVAPLRAEFVDYQSAEILHSIPFGENYQRRYGAPYLHVHRADLHDVMVRALNKRAPNSIVFNAPVTEYRESDNNVSVKLAGGREFTGDCLLACDGIRSRTRSQLLGATDARFTGNVAWRGVLPADRLPSDYMDKVVTNFIGRRKHMVIYYLRQQQLVNFVGVVENPNWKNDSWVVKSPWQALKADFAGWHPQVQSVIDAMDKDQCYRWALYDHKPLKNWSSKRVTLLGDAAHATLPFLASGAAMAIEDGRVLARALEQADDIERGLRLYQRNRFKRCAKIQRDSMRMSYLYRAPSKHLLKLAFSALALKPGGADGFLPDYDANTVELV